MKKEKPPHVLCQQWTEFASGQPVGPLGYSLHLSEEDWREYTDRHHRHQAEELGPNPQDFEDPTGDPYWVEVGEMTYARLANRSDFQGNRYYAAAPLPPPDTVGARRENTHQRYRR